MKSIELFAGGGGLALGISLAGFETVGIIERDRWSCDTIRENQKRGYPLVSGWPVIESDVRAVDWESFAELDLDLLSGGPPCQPFSLGGKHRAFGDERDMFPVTVEAVRNIRPKAFIVENVKGLTRSAFANYYQYILLQLEFPTVVREVDETWANHLARLQKEKTSGNLHASTELTYNVIPTLVNAADYGVPQKRERVFIVGFRSDLGIEWSFPKPTHSLDKLLYDQFISGEYWLRHRISPGKQPNVPERLRGRIKKLKEIGYPPETQAWRTVRDALKGLTPPPKTGSKKFWNHRLQEGAKVYPGHTGSPIDLPSKTLKAGDHGVPGGENMVVMEDGSVRYFSVRESARIQTFPDGYVFHGSWTETMRQLGNAVPVSLAKTVASSVAEKLAQKLIENQIKAAMRRKRA